MLAKKIILEYNPKEATQIQTKEFSSCVELMYPATRTDVAFTLEVFVIMLCVFIAGTVYMLHQKFK